MWVSSPFLLCLSFSLCPRGPHLLSNGNIKNCWTVILKHSPYTDSGLSLRYVVSLKGLCSTPLHLCLCFPWGKSQKYSILHSPFASCFQYNRPSSFVGELNNYSPLSRNANLLQCPACPSGLLLPVRPFHVWQSISPRRQSTAAPLGPAPGALWEMSAAVFLSKRDSRMSQANVPKFGLTLDFLFDKYRKQGWYGLHLIKQVQMS